MSGLKFYHNKALLDWIKLYLFDEYPDLKMEEYLIEAIVLGTLDYIKSGLEAEENITITSLGRFSVKKKENRYGTPQYYIKFKPSRHLVLNLREQKGTLTEAEKLEMIKKREFVQGMWEKKQAHKAKLAERKRLKEEEKAKENIEKSK